MSKEISTENNIVENTAVTGNNTTDSQTLPPATAETTATTPAAPSATKAVQAKQSWGAYFASFIWRTETKNETNTTVEANSGVVAKDDQPTTETSTQVNNNTPTELVGENPDATTPA